jgi:RNA polymerase sigma-70 factor (ECF subfamily)
MTDQQLSPTTLARASDDDLVAALRAGSPHALPAIHDRYHAALLAFTRRILGGAHHDAEEVVQDVFVKALKSLRVGDRDIALRPWLYAIARNRALDELRRPQHTVPYSGDEVGLPALGADPVSAINRRERVDSMVGHLNDLPTRQRRALVMLALEDRSHTQIGRVLRVSPGASKALVTRARATLGRSRGLAG